MIGEEFRKAWLPYFCRSGQRDTSLEEFNEEVEGWLPLLSEVALPRLTGQMLADVVQRKDTTAGSLKWLEVVGVEGLCPDDLLDAYIVMIPKSDGDDYLRPEASQCSPSYLPYSGFC